MQPPNYIHDPAAFVQGEELDKLRNILSYRDQTLYAAGSDEVGISRCYAIFWDKSDRQCLTRAEAKLIYAISLKKKKYK